MTVFEIIKRRRSIGKMTDQRPTRRQLERMIEAGTHAPNHHKVEPWRFIVLAGQARAALGKVMEQSLAARLNNMPAEAREPLLTKERNKLLRSPVVIVAVAEHPHNPKIVPLENIEATAAAVENMLLTAEEMGLACMWRTGDAASDPNVKEWLRLSPEDTIVSFLYVGYPFISRLERTPIPVEEKTTWLGWEDS